MSVIATVEVDASDFALGDALTANPGTTIRLERVIPLESTFIPYFWAADDTVAEIEAALSEVDDIESFRIVDSADGEALVRVEWEEKLDGLLDAVAATDGTILEGVGEEDLWRLQLRFPDHDYLSAFYRRCAREGAAVDFRSVHNPGLPQEEGPGLGLTEVQRRTLRTALDRGYFDVPRRTNLIDLAEELGVSDTAVSQRIRRGVTTLLEGTITERDGE
jgi:predicted DNA binding protein